MVNVGPYIIELNWDFNPPLPESFVMAGVSKALTLTTGCLSPLPRISAGACANVANDLGLGDSFSWVLRIPAPLTTD